MKNIISNFKFYPITFFGLFDNHIGFVSKLLHLKRVVNLSYLTLKQLLVTEIAFQTSQKKLTISMNIESIFRKVSLLRQVTIELRLFSPLFQFL